MTKWLPALIVLPVWLAFAYNKLKQTSLLRDALLLTSTILLVALPWQIYVHFNFPEEAAWAVRHNILHFESVLDQQGGGPFYYLNKIRINYSELIYIILVWGIYMFIKRKNRYAMATLLCWIVVPLLFFSLAATKMQGFISFIAPALFLLNAFFITELYSYSSAKRGVWRVLSQLLIVVAFALPVRYCMERMKFMEPYQRDTAGWQAMKKLKDITVPGNKKLLIYNVKHPIELMF